MDWNDGDEIFIPSSMQGGGVRKGIVSVVTDVFVYIDFPDTKEEDWCRASREDLVKWKAYKGGE